MSKNKIIELGTVKTIHQSGIVETDKKIRTSLDAQIGDRIIKDTATGIVSIAPKKAKETAAQKKARLEAAALEKQGGPKVNNTLPAFKEGETDEKDV